MWVSTVISCSVALFASALMVILAPLVADKALHDQSMTPLVRDGALLVLFSSIAGAQSGILAGMEAFKSIAKANLARGLVCIPLVVLGAKMFNVRGTVWGLLPLPLLLALCVEMVPLRVRYPEGYPSS